MSSLEDAAVTALRALLDAQLRESVATGGPLRLVLTEGQKEELAQRIITHVKALGVQRRPP